MDKKKLIFLSGPLALVCYILHDILGGLNYPGYDPLTQAVSDLTADSAPSLWISQPLSRAFGVLSILCAGAACVYLAKRVNRLQWSGVIVFAAMNVISAVGYTLFPLTDAGLPDGFQNVMHIVVTVLVVAASIVSLVLTGVGGFLKRGDRALGAAAWTAFALMLAGAVGSGAAPKAVFGIFERFSTYSAAAFTAFLGIRCMPQLVEKVCYAREAGFEIRFLSRLRRGKKHFYPHKCANCRRSRQ